MATCCSTREKRRHRFGGSGEGVTVVNLFVGFSVFFLLISCCGVNAFFIDLESLGFSTSKSDEGIEESSGAKLLIAAPSELEEIVEVEKTDDPNKSVKLTLAELKQLVLGTVKDLTPNPQPINIRITSSKHHTTSTTTTPPPERTKKHKYKDSMLKAWANSRDPDGASEEEEEESNSGGGLFSSYWNRPASTSYILPPYNYEGDEHYSKINDIAEAMDYRPETKGSGEEGDDSGWFSAAKAVFKAPNHVVKSFSRWRNGGTPKKQLQRQSQRPIIDITYPDEPIRRRRKRPPPRRSSKRPGRRRGHTRRGGPKHNQRTSQYNLDDEYRESDYSSYHDGRGGGKRHRYSGGMDHLTSGSSNFDSTFPHDFTPFDMKAPSGSASQTSFYG